MAKQNRVEAAVNDEVMVQNKNKKRRDNKKNREEANNEGSSNDNEQGVEAVVTVEGGQNVVREEHADPIVVEVGIAFSSPLINGVEPITNNMFSVLDDQEEENKSDTILEEQEKQGTDEECVNTNILLLTDGQVSNELLVIDDSLAFEPGAFLSHSGEPPEVVISTGVAQSVVNRVENISSPKLAAQEAQAIKARLAELEANQKDILQGRDSFDSKFEE
ncbi:hypothetical protein FRX31_028751 [Thalictrum thalictroides]|uniref:Uncharacterized protein n=1 Tax=Thalictrum thalictroides TaxID=46969 RepID=A0A7J6VBB8_THATH|nr:hypothetical protein FRX31_028751 [Thalictrum thalictroides]